MYKRILIKLSGESLMSDDALVDKDKTKEIAELIKRVREKNIEVGIVIGGGNFFRGRSNKDMYPYYVDNMGMLGTMINGIGLMDAMRNNNVDAKMFSPFALLDFKTNYSEEEIL